MRWRTIGLAVLLSGLMSLPGIAQCNRGGGVSPYAGGPTSGARGPQFTQSSLATNPYGLASAVQYQTRRAQQQQYAMLAQQRYRNVLAQQQRRNARQTRERAPTTLADFGVRISDRSARLRQENAEKAFALAVKAESKGRTQAAGKYYRRAMKIAGSSSHIIGRAESAIDRLHAGNSRNLEGKTITALAVL